MASMYGEALKLSLFGQSHGPAIGCTLDGMPAGLSIDTDALQAFLARRAPGSSDTATARREDDAVELLAGISDGRTNGAPIAAIIRNGDARSSDYRDLRRIPRPGHADLTAELKYEGHQDVAGGGHFSGRLTAPLCVAGGIALQALETRGVTIVAHIAELGPDPICDEPLDVLRLDRAQIDALASNSLPCISRAATQSMRACILEAGERRDSVGAVIECAAYGIPARLGDPMFDGMENRIARIAFGIPAVKGVEFGAGFAAARMYGSQHNDPYRTEAGHVRIGSNHAGGILGGITTGMPLVWRMAVKPTPSIGLPQRSVDLEGPSDTELVVRGRHDPCIAPRAVPVAEAACALAVLDAMLCCPGAW